jgi:hypothetical protein
LSKVENVVHSFSSVALSARSESMHCLNVTVGSPAYNGSAPWSAIPWHSGATSRSGTSAARAGARQSPLKQRVAAPTRKRLNGVRACSLLFASIAITSIVMLHLSPVRDLFRSVNSRSWSKPRQYTASLGFSSCQRAHQQTSSRAQDRAAILGLLVARVILLAVVRC